MYIFKGLCSTAVHILLSRPILIVGLVGLGAAAMYVKSFIREQPPPYTIEVTAKKVMENHAFVEKIQEAEKNPGAQELVDEAEKVFQGIILVESGGDEHISVHPDGVSHGPAGLTLPALKDVHRLVCNSSEKLDYRAILNDPEESVKFAKLYFLHMVQSFGGDLKIGTTAYHYGPTRVQRLVHRGKPLPQDYWNKVQKAMLAE